MENIEEIAVEEQLPVDPVKKPNEIWQFMKVNKLTDKDESTFIKEYSTPEKAREIHSFFKANKLTDKDENLFYNEYFVKKKASTKDSGVSAKDSQVIESESISTGEVQPNAPVEEEIDITLDPISLAKQHKKLSQPIETVTENVDMAGMPVGTTTEVDTRGAAQAEKISKHLQSLGYKKDFIDEVATIPEGYENDPVYGNKALSELYSKNKNKFYRAVSSLKWQSSLASAMQQKIDEVRSTNLPSIEKEAKIREIKDDNELFVASQNVSSKQSYKTNQNASKLISGLINKYIDNAEQQSEIKNQLVTDQAINFGTDSDLKYWDKNRIGNLNAEQSLALNFLEKTDEEKAKFYKRLLLDVDMSSIDKSEWAKKAYDQNAKELEELGNNLVYNNAKETYDDYLAKAKQSGGQLDPEDYKNAKLYESLMNRSASNIDNLKTFYPTADKEELDIDAQELVGERLNTPALIASSLASAFAKTGKGIFDIAAAPFKSEKEENLNLLETQGMEGMLSKYTTTAPDKNLYINSKLELKPELQAQVDEVKNDKNLTQDQKVNKVAALLDKNSDKWQRVKTEGKFNINPASVATSVFKLGADIAPYIAIEVASGGGASASILRKVATTFGAVAATTYQDELASAIKDKNPNPEQSALANIGINTIAFTVGGLPSKIRAAAGTETAIGKIINSLDDKAIMAALDKPPAKLADFLLKYGKKAGNAIVSSAKTAVPFQAVMAGKEVLQGADIDSDFGKQQVAQLLNFFLFGALAETALGKTKDISSDTRDALFLAGKNVDAMLGHINERVKSGSVDKAAGERMKENVLRAGEVYAELPKQDSKGNEFTEKQLSDLMYLKIKEGYIEGNLDKNLSKPEKEKVMKELSDTQDKIDKINNGVFIEDIGKPFGELKKEPVEVKAEEVVTPEGEAVVAEEAPIQEPSVVSKRTGGIEPEVPVGVRIATETGLTEQQRLDKIVEREKQTKISDKVNVLNALVQETKSFYERNKRQRNSSEGLRKLNELRIRARELGLEIDDLSESVVRKTGARKTKIKYNAKAEGDAVIDKTGKTIYERRKDVQDIFKDLNDNNVFLDAKTDLGTRMSDAQLDATVQDILDGVPSRRANRYLDEIEKAIDNDAFGLKDMGNNALTLEQIREAARDINKIESETVGAPMDEKAFNDFLNDESKLTPEEEIELTDDVENLLNEYEYEPETTTEREISETQPRAEERVPPKTEQAPGAEKAEAEKPGGQKYNDLTRNAKRRLINSKFEEIRKELKIEKEC